MTLLLMLCLCANIQTTLTRCVTIYLFRDLNAANSKTSSVFYLVKISLLFGEKSDTTLTNHENTFLFVKRGISAEFLDK